MRALRKRIVAGLGAKPLTKKEPMTEMNKNDRGSHDGEPVLSVRDLSVRFAAPGGDVFAVRRVSFDVGCGEALALVGESGSGKSMTMHAVMGLVESPPGKVSASQILYRGVDLLTLTKAERQRIRGVRIAMVFQDSMSALNPSLTVGYQVGEMFRVHRGYSWEESKRRAGELLERVQLPNPGRRLRDYPHQLSGGMRQRVMLAIAIALDPEVLIADEPTTALDVTVQAQIMNLFKDLQKERGMSLVLITHDLGVVSMAADRVAVMYAGQIVETGTIDAVYRRPAHPYTRALLASVPYADNRGQPLEVIPGQPPDPAHLPPGCSYHPRCVMQQAMCLTNAPALRLVEDGRLSACHFAEELHHG